MSLTFKIRIFNMNDLIVREYGALKSLTSCKEMDPDLCTFLKVFLASLKFIEKFDPHKSRRPAFIGWSI